MSCQRWAVLVDCFTLTFCSSSSHTSLMGFKSADCTDQDISRRRCYSSLLLMYHCQSLLVCFESLSCTSTKLWPTSHVPNEMAWCCDSRSDSICSFPGANPRLCNWQKSTQHLNRGSSMVCGWCDTRSCSSFTNSSPHLNSPIWPKDFELWFVSPMDVIPLLYCSVFVHLCPLEPFQIVLLPQKWFLGSGSAI